MLEMRNFAMKHSRGGDTIYLISMHTAGTRRLSNARCGVGEGRRSGGVRLPGAYMWTATGGGSWFHRHGSINNEALVPTSLSQS